MNNERVVPVIRTDLLSLYAMILKQNPENAGLAWVKSGDVIGNYTIEDGANPMIADQPVVTCDVADGVDATVYFIADPHYIGFSVAGAVVETTGDTVEAKNATLFKAVVTGGAVAITNMGV